MRIVTLDPYLTEIVASYGLSEQLVGISHDSNFPEEVQNLPRLTSESPVTPSSQVPSGPGTVPKFHVCEGELDFKQLCELRPTAILCRPPRPYGKEELKKFGGYVELHSGVRAKIINGTVLTLQGMYGTFAQIGKELEAAPQSRTLVQRVKAQIMDWGDNFYARMKNKRVTVLSSINPLRLAGNWIPDLIRIGSGQPQHYGSGEDDKLTTWADIKNFRPDVLVLAPIGYTLSETVKSLSLLNRVPEWDDLPATKRGEVIFADGFGLYRPGPRILDGVAILFSGMAGLESGYITPRDSFYRLRYVELHRHRL